jgi:hypothetical protein
MALVTLQQAKDQLDISHTLRDEFILSKADEASALVLAYVNTNVPDEGWTDQTVPADVRAAVLNVLADLLTNRGTDDDVTKEFPSLYVKGLLSPYYAYPVG